MSGYQILRDSGDFDDIESPYPIRNMPNRKRGGNQKRRPNKKKSSAGSTSGQIADQSEGLENLNLSYNASRHERIWLNDSLTNFFDQQWLDDVLRLVKGGKEANVYQCLANPSVPGLSEPYLAAKIYRPRRFRSLKKDHIYREGRTNLDGDGNQITEDGMLHAMEKRTEYGRELLHTSWIEHEVKTIQILHAAGADVPRVFASESNAILMSFIGDAEMAAPILYGIHLGVSEARRLFERVLLNLEIMLANQRVHGDFSAFNILYWEGEITVIDFPQAIDPSINRNAFRIFERDVARVSEYFIRQGVKSEPRRIAADMWRHHGFRADPEIHPALLDAEDERDRRIWADRK